jgi:hypothetical protein
MTNKELLELCAPVAYDYRIVYFSSEQYGFGKVLRKMYLYPKWLPICAYFEHSSPPFYDSTWNLNYKFLKNVFFHRTDFVNQWNKRFRATANPFMSPFVWYKEKKKINISKKAKGSVFFISHSSEEFNNIINDNKIIETINKLPAEFHPVTFCFYYVDIIKGLHLPYQKLGYNIVTAGNKDSPNFIDNFYSIIKMSKFALTNCIGGHLLFCVNFGIPVSYFENLEPQTITTTEDQKISLENFSKHKTPIRAKKMFKGINKNINNEQIEFVNFMLGLEKPVSRLKGAYILYKSLFYYLLFKIKR